MMRHKFAIAALCMLATGVHSITVNPRRNDGTLQRRAEVQFSIGLTLCSWFQGDKFGGSGGSYKQLLVAPGEKEIGCVEMDNSPHVPSDEYQEGEFFNIWNVCGMDIDFYNNDDGDWDFYESGGDGTMLVGPFLPLLSRSFCVDA